MLQDLDFGHLDNQYRNETPRAGDMVLCVQGGSILLDKREGDLGVLPRFEQVEQWNEHWTHWHEQPWRYAFTLQDVRYFLWMGEAGQPGQTDFVYIPAGSVRQHTERTVCFAAMTAWHIFTWYRSNKFCGRCGAATFHDGKERMMACPNCGNMIFPRIAPACIIGLTDGDRLMLSRYANRGTTRYGLLAGFVEIGETAEECVAREVMEEVGLKVKNVRYYKSQPWGIAGNLSLGYFCDLDGDDTVTLDEEELASAEWFRRDALPCEDDGFSLTREMIRVFGEGKEPK